MLRRWTPCIALLALADPASARQWTATRLHRDGQLTSTVNALIPGLPSCVYYSTPPVPAGSLWDIGGWSNEPVTWYGATPTFQSLETGTGEVCGAGWQTWAGSFNGHAALWSGWTPTRVD